MTAFDRSLHAGLALADTHPASPSKLDYPAIGQHLLADLHGIAPTLLTDSAELALVLQQAAIAAGAHILFQHFHSFGPQQGVTGVVLLAESHISIHTWPENGFAAVDIFMCGKADPSLALHVICQALAPQRQELHKQQRG